MTILYRTSWVLLIAVVGATAVEARARGSESSGPSVAFRSVETIWDLDVSRDGKQVVAASAYGNVRLFSLPSLSIVREIKTGTGPVQSVSFSHDGKWVAWGDANGNVAVIDIASGDEVFRTPRFASVIRVRFSPTGPLLAVSASPAAKYWDAAVEVWDVAQKTMKKRLVKARLGTYHPSDLAFSSDGKRLAVGISNRKHGIEVFDIKKGKRVVRIAHKFDVSAVAFSPDGSTIAAGGTDRKATLWSLKTRKPVWRAVWKESRSGYLGAVAVSPDGARIAACGRGSGAPIKVFGAKDGALEKEVGKRNPVGNAIRFTSDGTRVIVAFTTYGNLGKPPVVAVFDL